MDEGWSCRWSSCMRQGNMAGLGNNGRSIRGLAPPSRGGQSWFHGIIMVIYDPDDKDHIGDGSIARSITGERHLGTNPNHVCPNQRPEAAFTSKVRLMHLDMPRAIRGNTLRLCGKVWWHVGRVWRLIGWRHWGQVSCDVSNITWHLSRCRRIGNPEVLNSHKNKIVTPNLFNPYF